MKYRIGDLTKIRTGKLDANASSEDGQYPFFTCSKEPLKISTYSYDCECVLVAGNGDLNVKYYNGKFDAYQRTYIIEDNGKGKLYIPYLYYFMDGYVEELRKQSIGGVIKYIKLGNLTNALIELPDVETQKSIVKVLSKSKDILSFRQQQLQKLDELVKSRFIEMFGDPVENPKNWNKRSLLDMGTCKNGLNYRPGETGVSVYCLGVGDFKDLSVIDDVSKLSKIELEKPPSEVCMLKDDDIVFVRSNGNKALVGRCLAVYPQTAQVVHSGFCIRYRRNCKDLDTAYLLSVLKSDSMRMKMAGHGANIQNLNQKILASLDIPIPPLSLQNEFAEFVKLIDKSKLAIQQSLEKLETLKKALMQQYFG